MPLANFNVGMRETAPPFDAANAVSSTGDSSVVWIVASVVGGVFFLGAIFSIILVMYTHRRQQLLRQRKPHHPYLTRHEIARRRKLSESDFSIEEERRRSDIIRKSLANRSSVSGGSGYSVEGLEQAERELVVMERQESVRLKDDWKQWEARVRQERAVSPGQHPAARPATGEVPILAIPSPAKHRSQGRTTTTTTPTTIGSRPSSPPAPPSYTG